MKLYTIWPAAALAMAPLIPSADASVRTYQFEGVFEDGRTFSGSFSNNPDAPGNRLDQYSNVNVFLSGIGKATVVSGSGVANSASLLFFADEDRTFSIQLAFMASLFPRFEGLQSNELYSQGTFYFVSNTFVAHQLRSGTIIDVTAIPEPSGWALMLTGAACAAFALRRNRRQTLRVAFFR